MPGTTTEETLEIEVMPPTMTARVMTVRTAPTISFDTPKVVLIAVEIEFACVMLPIPKEARTAKRAKAVPRKRPAFLFLKPFFMVNIGPPFISPLAFTSRNLKPSIHSENLVVRPKHAEIHIQTRAPGPPANIAVATPTILPVPMVAASAVISAEKGETSPLPTWVVRDFFEKIIFNAYGRFLQVRKRSFSVM